MAEGNDDSVDFYLVQIGTRNGKRWRSTGLDLHDEIPIVPVDESDQFWYLERNENHPIWSFHTKSPEGDKLYVTYNKENPSDQKVSLEYDGSTGAKSSSRNFMLFLQPDGKHTIATPSSRQRMLGAKNGVLVLTDVEHPATAQDWIISNDLTLVVGQSRTTYVQVQEAGSPSKWISTNASHGDRVSVSPSSEEEWMASGTFSALTFKVPTQEFYASKTDESQVEIIFETDLASADMREFKIRRNHQIPPPAVLLQTVLYNWYVRTQGSVLQLKAQDFLATGWYLVSTRLVFTKQHGGEDIFPPFKSVRPSVPSH